MKTSKTQDTRIGTQSGSFQCGSYKRLFLLVMIRFLQQIDNFRNLLAIGRIYNKKRQEAASEYRDQIISIFVWQLNCYPKNTGAWDMVRFALEKF